MARPRKSSNLGGDPRGDTGAPAISTLQSPSGASTPPQSPLEPPKVVSEKGSKAVSSSRRKRSLFRRWIRFSLRYTWLNPLILMCIILGIYAVNPGPQNPVYPAIFLSYEQEPGIYGKGKLDLAFVGFYTIVLSFTREFIMQQMIYPWGKSMGIKGRGKMARFMEQAYTAVYFVVFGPFGLYVMRQTPIWYFNTTAMFEGFPHREHIGVFKAYYLLQASYWAQQAIVLILGLEARRSDFKELVGHHIVTLALIALSYRFHFTYMGIAVYVTHDISDFFLATSKTLNYIDSIFVGPYFVLFAGVWIYMRHFLNLKILWAILTEFHTVGPFELNWETQQYKCWISQWITFSLLAALQALNIFWLFLILRIAKRYVFASSLADERSEDEADEEEEEESLLKEQKAIEPQSPQVLVNGSPVPIKEKTATSTPDLRPRTRAAVRQSSPLRNVANQ